MKKLILMGVAALLLGGSLVGCQNTAEGAKEDTEKNTQAVQNAASQTAAAADKAADRAASATEKAANNVANATKEGAKNASAALDLTPKVKDAIVADKELNDTRNEINVDSKDNVVHLKGHVVSSAMKARAGEIAQKVLNESHATDTLSNELTVQK